MFCNMKNNDALHKTLLTVLSRDVEAEALRRRKHLTYRGSGSIFHKTWGRDVETVKFLWKRKHFHKTWGRDVESEAV